MNECDRPAGARSAAYTDGLTIRRHVLGDEYVDAALTQADSFGKPWQDFVTEHGWGAVWTRPGLPLKVRSMLNLALLTALNRPAELQIHLRGAMNNGVTREEVAEILIHCALYCGAPAAMDAFKIAGAFFATHDPDDGQMP